jgi:hypothetical protein
LLAQHVRTQPGCAFTGGARLLNDVSAGPRASSGAQPGAARGAAAAAPAACEDGGQRERAQCGVRAAPRATRLVPLRRVHARGARRGGGVQARVRAQRLAVRLAPPRGARGGGQARWRRRGARGRQRRQRLGARAQRRRARAPRARAATRSAARAAPRLRCRKEKGQVPPAAG